VRALYKLLNNVSILVLVGSVVPLIYLGMCRLVPKSNVAAGMDLYGYARSVVCWLKRFQWQFKLFSYIPILFIMRIQNTCRAGFRYRYLCLLTNNQHYGTNYFCYWTVNDTGTDYYVHMYASYTDSFSCGPER
jgi:hypothetical protein